MTPETDAAERMAFAQEQMVPTEFARRLERERDEAREEFSSIHRWIERNHADGFIDSLTYLQNLERVTDYWYDRIERERDEAMDIGEKLSKQGLEMMDENRTLKRERDEAREKAERYRIEANAMMMQRDEAREEVRLLKGILDLIKKDTQ